MWKTSPERRHVAGGDLFDLGQYPHGDAYPDCDGKGGPQQLGFAHTCIASYSFNEMSALSIFFIFNCTNGYQDVKLTERHHKQMVPHRCSSNMIGERRITEYMLFFVVPFRHAANRIRRMPAGRLAARCPAQLSASPVEVTRGSTFLDGTR